uniref:hypothetical protein n=1 Tax=Bacteroides fragilis TaxID=817 RepID=UPI003569D204
MYLITQITQRLSEINQLLTTGRQSDFSFEKALKISSFFQDYNDTNQLVKEAGILFNENAKRLLENASSLLAEAEYFLSLDTTELQTMDFEKIFTDHINPFKARCNETKVIAKDNPHTTASRLYNEWQQEEKRCFCIYCFKPIFLKVLVQRLKSIAGSIVSDVNRVGEKNTV